MYTDHIYISTARAKKSIWYVMNNISAKLKCNASNCEEKNGQKKEHEERLERDLNPDRSSAFPAVSYQGNSGS